MAQAVLACFLLTLVAGCSDQAPEPRPAAETNATAPAEANANATAPAEANATAPAEANATAAVLAEANATQAARALPAPARPVKASARLEKPPVRPAKAAASTAPPPAKAKVASAPSGPLTPERAHEEFVAFARQWVASLSRNMLGNAARMAVSPDADGYVARFAEVDQGSLEYEVKATDTPACPYVGVLKYFECSYESRGDSPEAAKAGTFSQVRKVRITELFRHSGKRWE